MAVYLQRQLKGYLAFGSFCHLTFSFPLDLLKNPNELFSAGLVDESNIYKVKLHAPSLLTA